MQSSLKCISFSSGVFKVYVAHFRNHFNMAWMYTVSFASLSIVTIFTFFVTEFSRWTGSDFFIVLLVAPSQDIKNLLVYFLIIDWLFKTKPCKIFVVKFLMFSAVCRHWRLSDLLQVFLKEYHNHVFFAPNLFYIHRFLSLSPFSCAKCPPAHKSPALWMCIWNRV